jgi:hypothetical protein
VGLSLQNVTVTRVTIRDIGWIHLIVIALHEGVVGGFILCYSLQEGGMRGVNPSLYVTFLGFNFNMLCYFVTVGVRGSINKLICN